MSYKLIEKNEAVKIETANVLIFGDPGIGKTSLAFTAMDSLLLDFDAGIQRACYRNTAVRIEKWEDINAFVSSADFKRMKPKTLIIDTAGAMLDNFLADYVKELDPKNKRRGGELSLQGYGAMKDTFKQFKDWAKSQKCNLIFIAHTTTVEEGDNLKFIPKVTGGSYDILRQECDLIGYFYSNKNQRVLDFNPCDMHIGKDCAEFGLIEVPDYKKPEYSTFMQSLLDRALERMNSISQAQLIAIKKVDAFKSGLNIITDLAGVEQLLENIQHEDDRAIQIQLFNLLKEHALTIGCKYDSESKKFVASK